MKYYRSIVRLFFLLLSSNLWSQNDLQLPSQIKWKEIKIRYFEFVFPEKYENLAKKIAATYVLVSELDQKYKIHKERKWRILINPDNFANGFVSPFPRKSEWFLGPGNTFENDDWMTGLAIHEGRHIKQFDKINQKLPRVLSFLGGDRYAAFGLALTAPAWFLEGDAVTAETRLGYYGRGRDPQFDLEFRALILEEPKQKYNYMRAENSSRRHFYPNPYIYGYYLVNYLEKHYGEDIFNQILDQITIFPVTTLTFSGAIHKITQKSIWNHFEEMKKELKILFNSNLRGRKITPIFNYVSSFYKGNSKHWKNWKSPLVAQNGDIFAIRRTLHERPTLFQWINKGDNSYKKKKLTSIFSFENIDFNDAKNNKSLLVWSSISQSSRWKQQQFSDIILYDASKKRKYKITQKGQYFKPKFHPSGMFIVATRFFEGQFSLVKLSHPLLSEGNNSIKKNNIFPNNQYTKTLENKRILDIAWSVDGKKLAYTWRYRLKPSDIYLSIININNYSPTNSSSFFGEEELVCSFSDYEIEDINNIRWQKIKDDREYLFFDSAYSGIDNIYAMSMQNLNIYQIASRKYGSYSPFVSTNAEKTYLTVSDYMGIKGAEIVQIDISEPANTNQWIPLSNVVKKPMEYFKINRIDKNRITILDKKAEIEEIEKTIKITPYNRLKNSLYIHSWGIPFFNLDNNTDFSSAFNLFYPFTTLEINSDNLLNTFSWDLSLGFRYTPNFNIRHLNSRWEWTRYLLLVNLNIGYNNIAVSNNTLVHLLSTSLGLTMPLSYQKDIHQVSFDFSHRLSSIINLNNNNVLVRPIFNVSMQYAKYYFAALFDVTYSPIISPFNGVSSVETDHYSLVNFSMQSVLLTRKDRMSINSFFEGRVGLFNNANLPTGFDHTPFVSDDIVTLNIDYRLPLGYPEIGIPFLVFIRQFSLITGWQLGWILSQGNSLLITGHTSLTTHLQFLHISFFALEIGITLFYPLKTSQFNRTDKLLTKLFLTFTF